MTPEERERADARWHVLFRKYVAGGFPPPPVWEVPAGDWAMFKTLAERSLGEQAISRVENWTVLPTDRPYFLLGGTPVVPA